MIFWHFESIEASPCIKRSNSQRGARNTQKKQVSDSTCCLLPLTSPSHIEKNLGVGQAPCVSGHQVSALSGGTLWALASWPNWTKSCVPHLQRVYVLTRERDCGSCGNSRQSSHRINIFTLQLGFFKKLSLTLITLLSVLVLVWNF